METSEKKEPRVYNAEEVFTVSNEDGEVGLDWNSIGDGQEISYIELDTGKNYGYDWAGNGLKLYIEKADNYSNDYPCVLAINGSYEDLLQEIAEERHTYPDIDNVVEEYDEETDYSKRFNNTDEKALIGFTDFDSPEKFILDTFDKHLYDRAFNQMAEKNVPISARGIEAIIYSGKVDLEWRNEYNKCAFNFGTEVSQKLIDFYKEHDWEIPQNLASKEKSHCIIERVPFGKWMARPENTKMRPIIDTLKKYMKTPLYVYEIPNDNTTYSGQAVALGINRHSEEDPITVFTMASSQNRPFINTVEDFKTLTKAKQRALHLALVPHNIDYLAEKDLYTLKTQEYKTDKDVFNEYIKIAKLYMERNAGDDKDNEIKNILEAGGNALSYFTTDEQKRLGSVLKSMGMNKSNKLEKILSDEIALPVANTFQKKLIELHLADKNTDIQEISKTLIDAMNNIEKQKLNKIIVTAMKQHGYTHDAHGYRQLLESVTEGEINLTPKTQQRLKQMCNEYDRQGR